MVAPTVNIPQIQAEQDPFVLNRQDLRFDQPGVNVMGVFPTGDVYGVPVGTPTAAAAAARPVPVPVNPRVPATPGGGGGGASAAELTAFGDAVRGGDYASAAAMASAAGYSPSDVADYLSSAPGEFGLAGPVTAETVSSFYRSGGVVAFEEGGMPKYAAEEVGSTFDISEYIDPETGRFYINEFQRDVVFNPELREAERIERLKAQGRGGDSMLVHMSPEEVRGLQALAVQNGTSLSINPETGLPEAFKLKKVLKAVAPALPFLIPGVGTAIAGLGAKAGLGALASKAIAAGVIGGFTGGGGFNFKQGLKTGAMAYAGGKLFEGMNAANAAAPGGQGLSTAPTTGGGLTVDPSAGGVSVPSPNAPIDFSLAEGATSSGLQAIPPTIPANVGEVASTSLTGAPVTPDYSLASAPSSAMGAAPATPDTFSGRFEQAVGVTPSTALLGGTIGYSLIEGDQERKAYEAQQAAMRREEEEKRRRYSDLFARTLGQIPMAAGGGMVAFAEGGMPTFEYGGTTGPTGEPRMVKGAGDGMSDNVPANIEGVQEARLANDEFVIPADVVADIGNGSSSAGAKKLYAMMDRVRKARHGTTEQPPEIKAERLMPA
jgi:hypothetical protein